MKNILKILSILFLFGLMATLSSCDKDNHPFPVAKKITVLNLQQTAGPALLTTISDPSTQFTFTLSMFEYGGEYKIDKVELCVVANSNASNWKENVVKTITGAEIHGTQKSATEFTPITINTTLQEVLTATATLTGGDGGLLFFYKTYMADGSTFIGWSKPTGDITKNPGGSSQGVFAMLKDEHGVLVNGSCRIPVICGLDISDFLGNWTIYSKFLDNTFTAVATEDPGKGLIFTVTTPGLEADGTEWAPAFDHPVKIGLNFDNYTWTYADNQYIWDDPGFLAASYSATYKDLHFAGGGGTIESCATPLSFSMNVGASMVNKSTGGKAGWAGPYLVKFTKVP